MLMVRFTKANGWTIKPPVMEYIHIWMGQPTRVPGKTICNTDKASRNGLTGHIMKEIMKMVSPTPLILKGKKNGKGIFKWIDSSSYEGEFFENNIHG